MKNFDNYECEGQMDMSSYLDYLKDKYSKCEDCIYYQAYKCVRQNCHKIAKAEGFEPLWTVNNRCFGIWPTCDTWREVDTISESEDGEIFEEKGRAKDKCFIHAKDSLHATKFKRKRCDIIAWRYTNA